MGKGEIVADGDDVLIIALGHMNQTALQTRHLLADQGISACVVDPIFVKPLDTDLLSQLLLKHQRIVTLEEHSVVAGLGAILNYFFIHQGFKSVEVLNLGIPETFIDHGSHTELLNEIGLTPEKIVQRICKHFMFDLESVHIK
jgi:1-deoxy-D-xylulose-5-phosphate synthase